MRSAVIPIEDRNRLIVERYRTGNRLKTISEEFGVSPERVRQIVLRANRRDREATESQELFKAIREANNLNRLWNRAAIFTAIDYPNRVRRLLDKHCHPAAAEVSLKQFMDWCLPGVSNDSDNSWDWLPAYRIKGFAQYNVGDLIRYIDRLDFGVTFGNEWAKRRTAFRAKFCGGVESGRRALI